MPLSENEQRLLEQMEQAMYAEDPKFASAMRGRSTRARQRRRFLLGGVALVVGLVLVVVGVAFSMVPVAVVGFVMMLAGAAFAAAPDRKGGPVGAVDASGQTSPRRRRPAKGSASRESFIARMEQRWDRRKEGDWGG